MTDKLNIDDLKRRMDGAISSFGHDLAGLRTGRASSSMIDHIMIDHIDKPFVMNDSGWDV